MSIKDSCTHVKLQTVIMSKQKLDRSRSLSEF